MTGSSAFVPELANGVRGEGKHTKLAGIIQVAHFFGDGAVLLIEKHSGTQERGLRQSAPPPEPATIARPAATWEGEFCVYATMVGRAAAQETRAAVGFFLNTSYYVE